ncbi:AMP-binding protein [Streptosporangium sp. CA-115845]|uniref:AMP-binding protein n=1 Tax=Streptosporangium sp. CA-115845 TaxID=3240071 RepID=UPI003D920983
MSPTTRELIVRGARQHAERTAVVFGENELTFAEVDELSNRLAHALTEVGGGHRRRTDLLVNNSLLSVPVDNDSYQSRGPASAASPVVRPPAQCGHMPSPRAARACSMPRRWISSGTVKLGQGRARA